MTMQQTKQEFAEALYQVIFDAPSETRQALFEAFKKYEEPRRRYLKKQPIADFIFAQIEDALMDIAMEHNADE